MAFIVWGGIALFVGIVCFILDRWILDDATCTNGFAGLLLAIGIFLVGTMISSIVVETTYSNSPIKREYFEEIEQTTYNLELINDNYYVLYDINNKTVNFIYYKDNYPILNNINIDEAEIHTSFNDKTPRVIVTRWQPKSSFARSFDKSHYEHTTYDIYLSSSELLMGGNP